MDVRDSTKFPQQVPEEMSISNKSEDSTALEMLFNSRPSLFMVVLTFVASISGFMFGYDTGYISSALVAIGTDLEGKVLSSGDKELITSATSLGALVASLMAGTAADIVGRKPVIMFSNLLFIVGGATQCGASTVWTMIAGRFIMGLGVGIGSLIAPLYISELAPPKFRGRLVILNCLALTGGQLIAYGLGAGLTHVFNGWRILVGLSLAPPTIQVVTFFFLPETPRYLITKGKNEQAKKVLGRTHKEASADVIEARMYEISSCIKVSNEGPFKRTWSAIKEVHCVPSNFRALVIACGLQGIQQFTGFNSLMYFSGTIFETIGFANSNAVSVIVAGTNFIFTVVAFFIIDWVGRRRILLIALPGMMIALIICAVAFHYLGVSFDGADAVIPTRSISGWGVVIIVGMILYIASYAVGIGNVPWQQSELFPQSVRGIGTSYSTATNWAGSLVIAATFLTMLEKITPTGTFALFGALTAVSIAFVYFVYPELSNLELEETQGLLTGGFNINASLKLAKTRRLGRLTIGE